MNEEDGSLTDETFVPSDYTGMIKAPGGGCGSLVSSRGVGEPLMHDSLNNLVTDTSYGVHPS